LARNAASNVGLGSKACPVVGECRGVAQGMSQGDFANAGANAAILGTLAMGSTLSRGMTGKVLTQAPRSSLLQAASLCTAN